MSWWVDVARPRWAEVVAGQQPRIRSLDQKLCTAADMARHRRTRRQRALDEDVE